MYFFSQEVLENVHPQNRKLRKKEAWETERKGLHQRVKGKGKTESTGNF